MLQDLHTPDETSTSTFRTLLSLRKDHQRRNSVAAVAPEFRLTNEVGITGDVRQEPLSFNLDEK